MRRRTAGRLDIGLALTEARKEIARLTESRDEPGPKETDQEPPPSVDDLADIPQPGKQVEPDPQQKRRR